MTAGTLRVVALTPDRCPQCGGSLEPTTMQGVTRCEYWPECRYIGGLPEVRQGRYATNRCKHTVTRMVVRMEQYEPLEVRHICDICGKDVPVPRDVILDYRGGYVRVVRST